MEAMIAVLVQVDSSLSSRAQQACTFDSHTLNSSARRLLGSRQAKQAATSLPGNQDTRPIRVLTPPSPASQTGNLYRAARAAISARAKSVSTQLKSTSAFKNCSGSTSAISTGAPLH